jgi:hypothetical protein
VCVTARAAAAGRGIPLTVWGAARCADLGLVASAFYMLVLIVSYRRQTNSPKPEHASE